MLYHFKTIIHPFEKAETKVRENYFFGNNQSLICGNQGLVEIKVR